MFIDTSAIVALLTNEPDHDRIADAVETGTHRVTSGVVRLETVMVVSRQVSVTPARAQLAFDQLLEEAQIAVMPITDEVARLAVEAFDRFGKGRGSKAQLNLGDCLSYAAAKSNRHPLLFIGNDFTGTDIESVLLNPAPAKRPR